MADITTIWDTANSRGDWAVPAAGFAFAVDALGKPVIGPDGFAVPTARVGAQPGAGLVSGRDIETAVLISVFTDAAAGPDDAIPDGSNDPRGWWGDPSMGSKVWLLQRAKRTTGTLQLAKAYLRDALAWLIADQVAASVDISAEWQGTRLACAIAVTRPSGDAVTVAFEYAWKDL
ncbi:phage GP46 family protein [Sphingomonas sp. CARO-RG-8B-R24-01]|uniref:phage GP46 family protein n=1 Tax=Sphingomonas sp. CARO-RG-8B-R24-01 TaxID=2914831 RepID=UPI001F5A82CA|nr:phage GP46 family protein [Sphingomonas sp. CARO-RG-8B-R24-01]